MSRTMSRPSHNNQFDRFGTHVFSQICHDVQILSLGGALSVCLASYGDDDASDIAHYDESAEGDARQALSYPHQPPNA